MCSMSHFFTKILPSDEDFQKQYARAFDLRNDYWAEEMVEIADDSRNETTRSFSGVEVEVPDLVSKPASGGRVAAQEIWRQA